MKTESNLFLQNNYCFSGFVRNFFLFTILFSFFISCNNFKKNCDISGAGCNLTSSFILRGLLVPTNVPVTVDILPGIYTITLNWSKIGNATCYKIYRKTSANVSKTDQEITGGSTTKTTITETSVPAGEKRYYRVSALINGIETSLSREVSSTAIITSSDVVPSKIGFWHTPGIMI